MKIEATIEEIRKKLNADVLVITSRENSDSTRDNKFTEVKISCCNPIYHGSSVRIKIDGTLHIEDEEANGRD